MPPLAPVEGRERTPAADDSSTRERFLVLGSATGGLAGAGTALFTALCCVGPSMVAVLGAGGALAAASLEPYRPFLLLVALVLIAFGFWRVYRRRSTADGRSCPVHVGRLTRTVLWISGVVWLAAALLSTA